MSISGMCIYLGVIFITMNKSLCCRDWLTLSNKKEVLQIEDLNRKFEEFQMACKTILPGVNRHLIENIILHHHVNPNIEYM